MTYVCYIDVLFLVNWMMNVVLLLLTGRFLRRQIHMGRLVLAAAVGSIWVCLSFVWTWTVAGMGNGLLQLAVWVLDWLGIPLGMIRIAYPDKEWRELLRGTLCLYANGILMGGLIHAVWENTRLGHFWQVWMAGSDAEAISLWLLALAMLGGSFALELGRRYQKISSRREQIQEVTLYYQERQRTVRAYWDSGNQLQDPCTGQRVHIVEMGELESLLGEPAYQYLASYLEWSTAREETPSGSLDLPKPHLIPCRSLGNAHTLLTVIPITKIKLADGSILHKPLVGISPVSLSDDGSYTMLLHSQTDEMRRNL